MGFGVGSYAKIWEVEDKGNYAMCKISISKRNANSNTYETNFRGTVAFFNEAYGCKPKVGQRIKIKNCDVTNKEYVKPDGTKAYPIKFYIFAYELQEDENGTTTQTGTASKKAPPTLYEVADDGDIPF